MTELHGPDDADTTGAAVLADEPAAPPAFTARLGNWSDLRHDRWTLVAAFLMLTLPAISRVDVGWDPAVAPSRRLVVLVVGLVATTAYASRWRVLRLVVAAAAFALLLGAGWRGVAITFLLSAVFAEVVRPQLLTTDTRASGSTGLGPATRVGLVATSTLAAIAAQALSQLPVLAVQCTSVAVGVLRVSLVTALGEFVVRTATRLGTPPVRLRVDAGPLPATPEPTAWARFPPADASATRSSRSSAWPTSVIASLLTFLAVVSATDGLQQPGGGAALVAAIAALVVGFAVSRPPRDRYLIEAAAAGGLAMLSLRWGALALTLVVILLEAGARGLLAPRSITSERRRGELDGLMVVVGSTLVIGRLGGAAPTIVLLVIAAIGAWHWPGLVRHLGRVAGSVVAGIRHVLTGLGAALVAAVGVLVVLVPFVVERLVGWDPTDAPRPAGTRFVPRHEQWTDDRRTWIPRTNLLRSPRRAMTVAARSLLAVAACLVLMVAVLRTVDIDRVTGERQGLALADSPWWPATAGVQAVTFDSGHPNAFVGVRLSDVRSRDTNVVDGRRVTWQPPTVPHLRVWIFGGSTTFGLGQRDDHTIASELAKGADAAGIPIEVTNFGVHGDVHWNETQRLRDALASGMPPPDLVIFYDGWNDFTSHTFDNAHGSADGETFRGTLDAIVAGQRVEGSALLDWIRPSRDALTPTTTTTLTPEANLDASIRQYRLGIEDSRSLLAARGIPAAYFLQPTVATRAQPVPGETAASTETVAMTRRFREQRPDGVVDLGAVMDGVASPIFFDFGHTNEQGAKIVADALLQQLLPTFRQLDGER